MNRTSTPFWSATVAMTRRAMSSWISNTLLALRVRSYVSAHKWAPVSESTSRTLTRTAAPEARRLPSNR